ncbi:MAG: DNA integrity scanning diadenylate cyclase DisA [Actinomycetota bacterium]
MSLEKSVIGDQSHQLLSASRLMERSNQALQTLERYRARLDSVARKLSAMEVEDLVTLRQVVEVLQRAEMVVRISTEIEHNLVELGSDGRLVRLQLEELMVGVEDDRRLLIIDYQRDGSSLDAVGSMDALRKLDDDELFDDEQLARTLHLIGPSGDLDEAREARGVRLLSKLPRMNETNVMQVVGHFGSLRKILRASAAELEAVDGIGPGRAKALKDGTVRLAGDSIIDQY